MDTPDTERNPFTRKRFILGVLLLALVALAGAILSAVLWLDSQRAATSTGPACERPPSEDTRLAGAVTVDEWTLNGSAPLPITPFGPSRTEGGAPACFERSPAGAAVAAAHIITLGSNGQTALVLEEMAKDSPATEQFLAQLPSSERAPSFSVQPVAVRVADYDEDRAVITVVSTTQAGPRAVDLSVVWEDGDWVWDTPTESLNVTVPASLSGYNQIEQPEEHRG